MFALILQAEVKEPLIALTQAHRFSVDFDTATCDNWRVVMVH